MEHILVKLGKERYAQKKKEIINFLSDNEANALVNDIENYPHAFVLACLMDRQIKAERAWTIPFDIKSILGTFDIYKLYSISLIEYKKIFEENKLHRFNSIMAEIFYEGVCRIVEVYDGDASRIWKNSPSSAKIVYDFLQFNGCGIKIATMATNILARDFKVDMSDYYSIDISPDVHIKKIMKRTGLVSENADIDSIIYKARELCPEFPGIIDLICWEVGRTYCKPINPNCEDCIIREDCKKIIK